MNFLSTEYACFQAAVLLQRCGLIGLGQIHYTAGIAHLDCGRPARTVRQQNDTAYRGTRLQAEQCDNNEVTHAHSTSTMKSVPRTLTVVAGVVTLTLSGCTLPNKPVTIRIVPCSTRTARLPCWVVPSN